MAKRDFLKYSNEDLHNLMQNIQGEIERRATAEQKENIEKKTTLDNDFQPDIVIGQETDDNMVVVSINIEDGIFIGRDKKGIEWECNISDYASQRKSVEIHKTTPKEIFKNIDMTKVSPIKQEMVKDLFNDENIDAFKTPMYGKIRPQGNIKDVPPQRIFEKKNDVKLDIKPDEVTVKRFQIGLTALIKDLRSNGAAVSHIALDEGHQIEIDGNDQNYVYQFPYNGENELFEGAKIAGTMDGAQISGDIVAVMERVIVISVKQDCGSNIEKCLLRVDNTAMLERLRDLFIEIENGSSPNFNLQMAEAVITNKGEELSGEDIKFSSNENINIKQAEAISKIMTNEVFYLWGPPGTGKTATLGTVISHFFERNKRILLCSNTNRAVDQVLLQLCDELGAENDILQNGQILRVGKISHEALNVKWHQFITVDSIVEKKSGLLIKRKDCLQIDLDKINLSHQKLMNIIDDFKQMDKAYRNITRFKSNVASENKKLCIIAENEEKLKRKLEKYEKELHSLSKANVFTRIISRDAQYIIKDIHLTQNKLKANSDEMQPILKEQKEAEAKLSETIPVYDLFYTKLARVDRKDIEKQVSEVEKQKQPIIEEITKINKHLDDITKSVFDDARIVGATVTKTYLSKQMTQGFDVVIVDEASMVMLPALYYVAGLSKEKVVISGDPLQLSPIIQTEQQEIYDAIGGDIFDAAKVIRSSPRVVMLEEQYRMCDPICKLISSHMYKGDLRTADERLQKGCKLPLEPFDDHLVIVDTSAIYPYVNKDQFKSRYNIMNAIAIRNICHHFLEEGFIQTINDIGICTPYAAEAKILHRIMDGMNVGNLIETGTVHRYQGDQKEIMILDIPDSLGERKAGVFLEAVSKQDNGSKLFNVAISRAKSQLIIFANLDYLDKKLPQYSFLRGVLADIVAVGKLVDVRSVLAYWPITQEIENLGLPFKLPSDTIATGLFNQRDFFPVCMADLYNAKKGIAIYSGFITLQRVASYEAVFRLKLAEGISIRIITRPPERNGSIPKLEGKAALDSLEKWGCAVDTRGAIHEKAVILDDEVVWFGSLNPLSNTDKTHEMMARISDKTIALQLAGFLALSHQTSKELSIGLSTRKENPRCPLCNARACFQIGKFGAYWKCEECDWKENLHQARRNRVDVVIEKVEPICPECGGPMVLRNGRFGSFYSCKQFPKCSGKVNFDKNNKMKK